MKRRTVFICALKNMRSLNNMESLSFSPSLRVSISASKHHDQNLNWLGKSSFGEQGFYWISKNPSPTTVP